MSKKTAADFVAMASENEALKEKVRSKGGSYSEERFTQAVAVGREQGFDFTAEDLRSVLTDDPGSGEGELMEEQLEEVVGGLAWYKWVLGKAQGLLNGSGSDSGGGGSAGVRG